MLLEFDSRCGTAQPEDTVGLYISRRPSKDQQNTGVVPMLSKDLLPVHDQLFGGPPGGNWPKRPMIVSGRLGCVHL